MFLHIISIATRFISSQVVASTLRAVYRVHLSIRRSDQQKVIAQHYSPYASRIGTVIIADMTNSARFKGAVKGVWRDVKADYAEPAVKWTESVLSAAKEHAEIQKVIVMSSVLALLPANALLQHNVSVKPVCRNTGEVNSASGRHIGGINTLFWMSVFSEKSKIPDVWVHVRDVADAHLNAFDVIVQTGTEFILPSIKINYPSLGCKLEPPFEGS
ncbi:hypothetical protein K469DRAFT_733055 [Zopfia rhizophila CBS 207.26]|uniref:NAD(P)-binding protein n=1 Tax=Zopfia rhizophila CBS 207.26 TaxID=1314779 RepID=A0A6A6DCE2_9PEZI|nr:hypothetical protein K469DRAFT_733055 [Zopfia rhizophila CBS 207.26]